MVSDPEDQLLRHAEAGSIRGVTRLLATGLIGLEGTGRFPYTPLMVAANGGHGAIVDLLLEKGANLEAAVAGPNIEHKTWYMKGSRALHIAAAHGKIGAFMALIRAGANVNATDAEGRTPLIYACNVTGGAATRQQRAAIAQALLDNGADPSIASDTGAVAMHFAATHANEDVIDTLFSASPPTLNVMTAQGHTPLCSAAGEGNERTVSHLLSLGASDLEAFSRKGWNALNLAAQKGQVGVCRLLIDTGLDAVGGLEKIPHAIVYAIQHRRILELLLAVEGEDRRHHWATCCLQGWQMLHYAAAYCSLAAIPALFAAGADETSTFDPRGQCPNDVIGVKWVENNEVDDDLEDAIDRMLQRGPAYRARSWAYPVTTDGTVGVPDCVLKPTKPVGVSIFRPRCKASGRCFTTRLAR